MKSQMKRKGRRDEQKKLAKMNMWLNNGSNVITKIPKRSTKIGLDGADAHLFLLLSI